MADPVTPPPTIATSTPAFCGPQPRAASFTYHSGGLKNSSRLSIRAPGRSNHRPIGELLGNPNVARVRHVERGLAAAGHPAIHAPHLPVLEAIDQQRGSRISDLARRASVTPQAMSDVVAYLERHGYLERVPDSNDGRARLVHLTDRGRELCALADRLVSDLEARWSSRLGERKFHTLKRLLAELWDAVEPDA
jgi:DNA-binding MarR family transcriptional regulator